MTTKHLQLLSARIIELTCEVEAIQETWLDTHDEFFLNLYAEKQSQLTALEALRDEAIISNS